MRGIPQRGALQAGIVRVFGSGRDAFFVDEAEPVLQLELAVALGTESHGTPKVVVALPAASTAAVVAALHAVALGQAGAISAVAEPGFVALPAIPAAPIVAASEADAMGCVVAALAGHADISESALGLIFEWAPFFLGKRGVAVQAGLAGGRDAHGPADLVDETVHADNRVEALSVVADILGAPGSVVAVAAQSATTVQAAIFVGALGLTGSGFALAVGGTMVIFRADPAVSAAAVGTALFADAGGNALAFSAHAAQVGRAVSATSAAAVAAALLPGAVRNAAVRRTTHGIFEEMGAFVIAIAVTAVATVLGAGCEALHVAAGAVTARSQAIVVATLGALAWFANAVAALILVAVSGAEGRVF